MHPAHLRWFTALSISHAPSTPTLVYSALYKPHSTPTLVYSALYKPCTQHTYANSAWVWHPACSARIHNDTLPVGSMAPRPVMQSPLMIMNTCEMWSRVLWIPTSIQFHNAMWAIELLFFLLCIVLPFSRSSRIYDNNWHFISQNYPCRTAIKYL